MASWANKLTLTLENFIENIAHLAALCFLRALKLIYSFYKRYKYASVTK